MTKKKYLVGVDGSEWGNRAAVRAVELAKLTGHAVHIVNIIPWSGHEYLTQDGAVARTLDKEDEEKAARDDILKDLTDQFADSGVEITTDYKWGNPVELLHDMIVDMKIDMVFAGRRGRSRIADLVVGSVSNTLAHVTSVPIVLVP